MKSYGIENQSQRKNTTTHHITVIFLEKDLDKKKKKAQGFSHIWYLYKQV